jgi:hypothetical protein
MSVNEMITEYCIFKVYADTCHRLTLLPSACTAETLQSPAENKEFRFAVDIARILRT